MTMIKIAKAIEKIKVGERATICDHSVYRVTGTQYRVDAAIRTVSFIEAFEIVCVRVDQDKSKRCNVK